MGQNGQKSPILPAFDRPEDGSMLANERRAILLEVIRVKGFASLPELAGQLGVSESTIRRDLDYLEESGAAKRTHGGVFYTGPSPKLQHFDQIQSTNWEKKRSIAQHAAGLIREGDTVLLDGGSTTYELAQLLVGRTLQVVTNSLPVANLFSSSDSADLVFIGGYVHSRTGVSLGPYAVEMLSQLNCRRAMLSVAGVHEDGLYNSNLLLVETERAMMKASDEVVVLADSTKFGHKSLARICDLNFIDTLVVDDELSQEWRSRLQASGIEVIETPVMSNSHSDLG